MSRDFAHLSRIPSLDADYRFGRPTVYLAPHELARLHILRSRLGDTHAERIARAAGRHLGRRAATSHPSASQPDFEEKHA